MEFSDYELDLLRQWYILHCNLNPDYLKDYDEKLYGKIRSEIDKVKYKFIIDITNPSLILYYEVGKNDKPDFYLPWLKMPKNSEIIGVYHELGDLGIKKWKKANIRWREIIDCCGTIDMSVNNYKVLKKKYADYWRKLSVNGKNGTKGGKELQDFFKGSFDRRGCQEESSVICDYDYECGNCGDVDHFVISKETR